MWVSELGNDTTLPLYATCIDAYKCRMRENANELRLGQPRAWHGLHIRWMNGVSWTPTNMSK